MLRPKAILETVLYVDDLETTADFYETVLQLTPVHNDDRMHALRVSDENFLLLFKMGATTETVSVPGGEIPPHDGKAPIHLALTIDKADTAAWSERLRENDVLLESKVDWASGETSLYFRDPAGNLVELATPNLWKK